MNRPIYQHFDGDLTGNLYKDSQGYYYYRIYIMLDGKNRLAAQSYVNLVDRELCLERMLNDMKIIERPKNEKENRNKKLG